MLTKKLKIILPIILVTAFFIYKFWPGGGSFEEPPFLVEAQTVAPDSIAKHVTLLANVKPLHQAVFVAQQNGRMKNIFVEEGTHVKSGTVLAELDNEETTRAYQHAEIKSRLAKAQYERILEIFKQGSQSKAALEKAHDAWLRAEIEFETLQEKLKNTQFIMPFDGICGVFKARIGQSVSSGETVVTCYDISQFVLDIDVPESILSDMRADQAIAYKEQKDKIRSVQNIIDPDTRMGIARAIVPNTWPVAVGQLISLDVTLINKENVITVPKTAVFIQNGQDTMYVIKDNQAMPRPVKVGIENNDHFEIIEGLEAGETYILRGQENIWPTRKVKIAEKPKATEKAE